MAFRSSSIAHGVTSNPSTTVPAGVAANDIIVLQVISDNQTDLWSTHWPSGFTHLGEAQPTTDGGSVAWSWKRTTGADTGSYTLTTSTAHWELSAYAFSGRDTTNAPVAGTVTTNSSANTSPVTASANGVTAVSGDDLFWGVGVDATVQSPGTPTFTAPTGYTKQVDDSQAFAWGCGAYRASVSAGATGTISGSFSFTGGGSAGYGSILIRIPAAAGGGTTESVAWSTTGQSAPAFTLLQVDKITVGATGSAAPSFTLLQTDKITTAITGSSAPSFSTREVNLLGVATTGHSAPSVSVEQTDRISLSTAGQSNPRFGLTGGLRRADTRLSVAINKLRIH